MFDIGFWEFLLLAVIGLIVLGPERLPVVARTLGTWIGRAKGYVRGLTSEIEREVDVDNIRSGVRQARDQFESARDDIEAGTRDTIDTARQPWHDLYDGQSGRADDTTRPANTHTTDSHNAPQRAKPIEPPENTDGRE